MRIKLRLLINCWARSKKHIKYMYRTEQNDMKLGKTTHALLLIYDEIFIVKNNLYPIQIKRINANAMHHSLVVKHGIPPFENVLLVVAVLEGDAAPEDACPVAPSPDPVS